MSDRLPSNSADGRNKISVHNHLQGTTRAEVINQGVGDVYIHILNGYKAESFTVDEIEKCCDEIKGVLDEKLKTFIDCSSNFSDKPRLKKREFSEFGLKSKNNRSDVASFLNRQLACDIAIKDLFKESKERAQKLSKGNKVHQSNFVGLVGAAKIGKTSLIGQIIRQFQKEFDFVFYVNLKEILCKRETSLDELLLPFNLSWMKDRNKRLAVFEAIVNQKEKIFLILDDLDSSKLKLDGFSSVDWFENRLQTSSNIILNILRGNVFQESKKLVVSRYFELDSLPENYRPAFVVHVVGLPREVQENVCKHNKQDREETFGKFQSLPDIHLLCAVPLNCQAFLNFCKEADNCFTHSIMFVTVFYQFLLEFEPSFKEVDLRKLADFAWSRFKEKKDLMNFETRKSVPDIYVFNQKVLEENDLAKSFVNSFFVTFFCKNPLPTLKKYPILKSHFACLLMHDFFVALKLQSLNPEEIENFLSGALNHFIQHSKNSHVFVVIMFLFGFCHCKLLPSLSSYFIEEIFSETKKEKVKAELKKFINKLESSDCESGANQNLINECSTILKNEIGEEMSGI